MSKGKKIKIIVSIVAISFIQGLQYCVSPVLGQIREYYSDVEISLVQMLITAPALISMFVALLSGWLVVKISKKAVDIWQLCGRNNRVSSFFVGKLYAVICITNFIWNRTWIGNSIEYSGCG